MKKILIYIGFVISSLIVIAAFVTATTYTQLAIAIALYPILILFAFKTLVSPTNKQIQALKPRQISKIVSDNDKITDEDKRAFLKLVGAAGLSFLLFSILNKLGINQKGTISQNNSDPQPVTSQGQPAGYSIAEIDEGNVTYYGFTNKEGAWLIMKEDTETNSFRYAKGLLTFPTNWSGRKNLKYDYYHNLF